MRMRGRRWEGTHGNEAAWWGRQSDLARSHSPASPHPAWLVTAHTSPRSCWAVQARDGLLAWGWSTLHITTCALSPLSPPKGPPACQHRRDLSPIHSSRSATFSHVIAQQNIPYEHCLLHSFLLSLLFLLLWCGIFHFYGDTTKKVQPGPSPLCWALWREDKKFKKKSCRALIPKGQRTTKKC